MSQKHLKVLRIVLSIIFLLFTTFLFIDFRELIPTAWADRILFLQFVPSAIRFVDIPAIAAVGFIIILILGALFGRVYCSVICPLGILQDVFAWIAKKTKLIKRYKFRKALDYIRYPLLAITIGFLLFGSIYVLNFLDPYSIFGRIFSDLVRPGVIAINNGLARLLEKLDVYFLYRSNLALITWRTVLIPVVSFLLVIILSLFYGRLYCNTVCPVGTILGLVSRISVFRIKMNAATCNKCGKCSFACKSNCIHVKTLKVDNSRCVACYNCISVCPENSISYVRSRRARRNPAETDTAKRSFIIKSLVYGAILAGISKRAVGQDKTDKPAGKIPNKKTDPVTPPGSVSINHFTSNCTACHLCVSVCPTSVLQPSYLEYGFTGISQPHMDYGVEYCNYECTKCGEVCPTGAIMPLTVEDKKIEQIGQVHFVKEKCIVYTDNTACGSCSEHCPTQAVRMVPYKEELTIPETDPEICIGCGACEFACPVKPHTAIFVNGNAIHKVAKAPKVEKVEEKSQEEFPF